LTHNGRRRADISVSTWRIEREREIENVRCGRKLEKKGESKGKVRGSIIWEGRGWGRESFCHPN